MTGFLRPCAPNSHVCFQPERHDSFIFFVDFVRLERVD